MAHHLPSHLSRRRFLQGLILGVPALLAGAPSLFAARRLNELSLKFLSSVIPLNRRSSWSDYQAKSTRLKIAAFFSRITVHHSGALVVRDTDRGSVIDDLNSVLDAHTRVRRYGDIGYHFVIDYAGRVWEGRSLSYEGAHVSGENEGNIGVMLLGNFEKQKPSSLQLATLETVITRLRGHFDIPARRVYGHRDIGFSLCPGRYLYPHVVALKSKKSRPTLA
jgi:hypothetical protein